MRTLWLALLLLGAAQEPEADRSPVDLALSPDGRWALCANRDAGSVSLVDLAEGKVAAEVATGRWPFAVAWQGKNAVVSNGRDHTVTLLTVAPPALAVVATVPVGNAPRGVAILGARIFVACSDDDRVDVLEGGKVVARIPTGREPGSLAAAAQRIVAANALSGDLTIIDAATLKVAATLPVKGRNLRRLALSADASRAYVPHITDRGAPTTLTNIERGLVLDNRLSRIPLDGSAPAAMGLDTKGFGAGDPEAVALSADGTRLALTLGGTRNLLLLALPLPFKEDAGEFLDEALQKDKARYRRVAGLRGRPVGCAFTPDGASVVVANALGNAIQVVSWESGEIVRSIPLGGPEEPELARKGEAIFYDAFRSWHEWYSCHTCHPDGHSNGGLYDTLNDGRYGNPKKTLSLRGLAKTGPWTWHGQHADLGAALQGSFTQTMARQKLSKAELEAVTAFVRTIDFAPDPREAPSEEARRGEAVFKAKGCATCHAPPTYTTDDVVKVGLESPDDYYKNGFSPPSLRAVSRRGPWLHDGRAKTLEEVFRHHRPSVINGRTDPSEAELADLLAFLRSL